MARPLTPKQEKFAQEYVNLGNASEAYRRAYDAENMQNESIWVNACKLTGDAKVAIRIQELRDELAERNAVTVDSISKELDVAIKLAQDLEQASPMVTGIMGKAKLYGLLVDKQEHSGKDGGAIKHVVSKEAIKEATKELNDEY